MCRRPLPSFFTCSTVPNYAEEDLGMMAFALSACDKTLPPDWNREEMTDYWVEKISRRRIRERLEKRIDLARWDRTTYPCINIFAWCFQ